MKQWIMKSPIGPLSLVASQNGLKSILWERQSVPMAVSLSESDDETAFLNQAVTELKEYFLGKRKTFSIPLDIGGTEFQQKVWNQTRKIPYGKTLSYSDIAKKIENAKAVRAVGTANGRNLLSIIIPCHRVIAADGTLGGYAGGLVIKERLLKLEQTENALTKVGSSQLELPISEK